MRALLMRRNLGSVLLPLMAWIPPPDHQDDKPSLHFGQNHVVG